MKNRKLNREETKKIIKKMNRILKENGLDLNVRQIMLFNYLFECAMSNLLNNNLDDYDFRLFGILEEYSFLLEE